MGTHGGDRKHVCLILPYLPSFSCQWTGTNLARTLHMRCGDTPHEVWCRRNERRVDPILCCKWLWRLRTIVSGTTPSQGWRTAQRWAEANLDCSIMQAAGGPEEAAGQGPKCAFGQPTTLERKRR
jgi:hypothetical protein